MKSISSSNSIFAESSISLLSDVSLGRYNISLSFFSYSFNSSSFFLYIKRVSPEGFKIIKPVNPSIIIKSPEFIFFEISFIPTTAGTLKALDIIAA